MIDSGGFFGDYKVVRRLGKGGMGEVWLLEGTSGSLVAAKILDPETARDHESRKRFLREAQLALGVKHPNLVEVYDVGEDPDSGLCYILMEYVAGGTLADFLARHGALPIEDAIAVIDAIANVLELGRQKGIVHRDIKPANIMFASDGTPKLADLGIARGHGTGGLDTTTVTQTGMLIGTPAYMAPEQMLDAHNVDTRADIYSLGVVFFEMLTGERPNKDDTVVQLMAKAVKGEPLPDVRTLRPEVSASLAQLLNMMVVPDRNGRISTPGQITTALEIIARGGTFDQQPYAAPQPTAEAQPLPQPRARRFPWVAVALLFVFVCLAVAFFFFAPKSRPPARREAAVAEAVPVVVARTNVVERVVEKTAVVTNVVQAPPTKAAQVPHAAKSPYVLRKISELEPRLRKQLEGMGARRKSGSNRGIMAFGRLKVDGVFTGKGVATYAWLNDDGWFTADIYSTAVKGDRHAGRRIDFQRHGYQEVEIDLTKECDRKWSNKEALDLGCLEMAKLTAEQCYTLSLVPQFPEGVDSGEVIVRLKNDKPCGYDWSACSSLQRPSRYVVNRRVTAGERIEVTDCSPAEYVVKVKAEGCAAFEKKVDVTDATACNLHTVTLPRVKTAQFAIRPFVGGPWQTQSVEVDNERTLNFHDGKSHHRLSLNPFETPRGLQVSSYYQPSSYDDYGELTTKMFDAQMAKGTLANPFPLNTRGKANLFPGRIYRFRNSYMPIDVLIAFQSYQETPPANGSSPQRPNAAEKSGQDTQTPAMKLPAASQKWIVSKDDFRPIPVIRICFDQSHGGAINENSAFYLDFLADVRGFQHAPCWYGLNEDALMCVNALVLPPSWNDISYLPEERGAIRVFLENGGTVFAIVNGNDNNRAISSALLAGYGLSVADRRVSKASNRLHGKVLCPALADIHNVSYEPSSVAVVTTEKDAAAWSSLVAAEDGAPIMACRAVGKGHLVYASAGLCLSKEKMRDHPGLCRLWKRLFLSAAKIKKAYFNAGISSRGLLMAPCRTWETPLTFFYAERWKDDAEKIIGYVRSSLRVLPKFGVPPLTQAVFGNVALLSAGSMRWQYTDTDRYMIGIQWDGSPQQPGGLVVSLVANALNNTVRQPDDIPLREYLALRCLNEIGLQREYERLMQENRNKPNDTNARYARAFEAIRKDCPDFPAAFCSAWTKITEDKLAKQFFDMLSKAIGRDCRPYFTQEGIAAFGLGVNAAETPAGAAQDVALAFTDREIGRMKGLKGDKAVQKALDRLFPGWRVSGAVGIADEGWNRVGYVPEINERRNVCCTLPKSVREPVKLTQSVVVPEEGAHLFFSVRKTPYYDAGFKLELRIDGKSMSEYRIEDGAWRDESFDLSPWKGKKIRLEFRHYKLQELKHARASWSRLEVQ